MRSIYCLFILFYLSSFCYGSEKNIYTEIAINNKYNMLDQSLSNEDVSNLNYNQLRILRNFYFARKGHRFKSQDLSNFFNQYSWYKPTTTISLETLTDIQKQNIDLIKKYEKIKLSKRSLSELKKFEGSFTNKESKSKMIVEYIGKHKYRISFIGDNFVNGKQIREMTPAPDKNILYFENQYGSGCLVYHGFDKVEAVGGSNEIPPIYYRD